MEFKGYLRRVMGNMCDSFILNEHRPQGRMARIEPRQLNHREGATPSLQVQGVTSITPTERLVLKP
ncbi:hypothetical protein H6F88_12025 [Oculatella sp. FACHB-28]|uniref:hypothetical protein n=1 Tax=Oculatella sp. FACHB-28 TaxID=2692845 RepID=UPI0016895837|nr:hypothetical protein [Oculatella sp. FACHB-28]MBD2056731.1 hypothetical protein [Oculatella sp. FACHB-28]